MPYLALKLLPSLPSKGEMRVKTADFGQFWAFLTNTLTLIYPHSTLICHHLRVLPSPSFTLTPINRGEGLMRVIEGQPRFEGYEGKSI